MNLTSTHEDYLEIIFRLNQTGDHSVTISKLASELGCRLPTVTRTIKALTEHGYVHHEHRGDISLSPKGKTIAQQVAHRHDDVTAFLHLVLGLDHDHANADACKIEHGFSPLAAERLHAFMEIYHQLNDDTKSNIQHAVQRIDNNQNLFGAIQESTANGRRH